MKISIVCGMTLLAGTAALNGMDNKQQLDSLALLSDVGRVIINCSVDTEEKRYCIHNTSGMELCIPCTHSLINPVVFHTKIVFYHLKDMCKSEEKEGILLDHQLWLDTRAAMDEENGDYCQVYVVKLKHDSANNTDTFSFKKENTYKTALFDGINNKRCALLVLSASTDKERSCVYFLRQSPLGQGAIRYKGRKKSTFSLPGFIQSALLHRDENRIVYSMNNKSLTVADVDDQDQIRTVASTSLDILIKKTIYLGVNKYLGLTMEGKLAHIWLDKDNNIRHSMINLTKYDEQTKKYVPSDSVVKDIAVDDACKMPNGVRPRIAYITNKGEVFVMDFGCFKKPAPLLNKEVENAASDIRLFYDKGELAVLYADAQGTYQDFVRWLDNLSALYLKAVLVQQERSLQN